MVRTPTSDISQRTFHHCDLCYQSTLVVKGLTTSWRKGDMRQWLRAKISILKIPRRKHNHWHLLTGTNSTKRFKADELAQQYGHEVLRLPPYHCIFNPIENMGRG